MVTNYGGGSLHSKDYICIIVFLRGISGGAEDVGM